MKIKKTIEYLIKSNRMIQFFYKHFLSFLMKVISLFIRVDENLYFFTGHSGGINDSPKVIYDRLLENKDPKTKIIWGIDKKKHKCLESVNTVQIDTFKYFIYTMKAKYWVASVNIERGLNYKKKKQIYLNTWHGIPIKTIGNDAPGRKDFNFSSIDYLIVSGEYERKIYQRAFKIPSNHFLNAGLPRNEELYKELSIEEKNAIKKKLSISLDKKVILYAPTWRDSDNKGKSYDIAPPITIKKWKTKLEKDYIILMRLHPYTEKIMNITFDDFFRDVSQNENLNDLIKIANILITDYSSIAFDFSITGKPVMFFAYDFDEYNKSRGLYINLSEECPLSYSTDEDVLLNKLIDFQSQQLSNESINFYSKYIQYHGNSIDMCLAVLKKNN